MIQFARAVGLEESLASYGLYDDLLLKARVSSGVNPIAALYRAARSFFASVARSSVGDDVAALSVTSLPTITETKTSNVVNSEGILEGPCSSGHADVRSVENCTASQKLRVDSSNTLQQIKSSEKKKKASMRKWSRESRLNPLLPYGDERGGFAFTEKMLELAPFAKVFATRPENTIEKKLCFYCMLPRRITSVRTRELYELKCHYERNCQFRVDQRFRENLCPGNVRG